MISLFSGTPGSGKSLHVARIIYNRSRFLKGSIITNMPVDMDYLRRGLFREVKIGSIVQLRNNEITPDFFIDYAYQNHKKGKEGQTLIIIDEAQMLFSPTVIKLKSKEDKEHRVKWLDFFSQHRHLGYNIILVTQFDRLIDPQIRCMFEYNYIHRQVNRFKFGALLGLFGIKLFIAVQVWYGVFQKCGSEFFTFKKKFSKVYDSFSRFEPSTLPPSLERSKMQLNEEPPFLEASEAELAEEAQESLSDSVCNEEKSVESLLTTKLIVVE